MSNGALVALAFQLVKRIKALQSEEINVENLLPSEKEESEGKKNYAPHPPRKAPTKKPEIKLHVPYDAQFARTLREAIPGKDANGRPLAFWSYKHNDFVVSKDHAEELKSLLTRLYSGKVLGILPEHNIWVVVESEEEAEGFECERLEERPPKPQGGSRQAPTTPLSTKIQETRSNSKKEEKY